MVDLKFPRLFVPDCTRIGLQLLPYNNPSLENFETFECFFISESFYNFDHLLKFGNFTKSSQNFIKLVNFGNLITFTQI